MSCYHPLKGFIVGYKDNGKKDIKIRSYEVDHIELLRNGQFIDRSSRSLPLLGKPYYEYDTIPCGRCIGCRLQYSKAWMDRAVLELSYHKSNYFVTLTYNDDNVPHSGTYNDKGEFIDTLTLDKKDLQLFWKRLRKYLKSKNYPPIRYFACGEYGHNPNGDNLPRPHYHAIIYGLELDDLKVYKRTELGDWLYTSKTLEKIWHNGYVVVGNATHESIGYVARYVTKKKYGQDKDIYEKLNIIPEFLTMSRKPGIARKYYEDNKENLFKETKYFFPTRNGIGSATPSRYFNDLFERDFDSAECELRKEKLKKQYEDNLSLKLSKSSLNYLDYMSNEEYNKKEQIKALKRNVCL